MFDKFKHLTKEEAQALLQSQLTSARTLKNSDVDPEYFEQLLRDINLLELYIKTLED